MHIGLPQSVEMNNVSVPMANMSMSSSQPSALPPMKPQAPTINNNTGMSLSSSQPSALPPMKPQAPTINNNTVMSL